MTTAEHGTLAGDLMQQVHDELDSVIPEIRQAASEAEAAADRLRLAKETARAHRNAVQAATDRIASAKLAHRAALDMQSRFAAALPNYESRIIAEVATNNDAVINTMVANLVSMETRGMKILAAAVRHYESELSTAQKELADLEK